MSESSAWRCVRLPFAMRPPGQRNDGWTAFSRRPIATEAPAAECYTFELGKPLPMNRQLGIVLFSGGRGTQSICEVLLKHPQVELSVIINAYDDGLSTGAMRRFV